MSTEYLIKKGRKNIAFVVGPPELLQSARERFEGYKQALKKHGIQYDKNNVFLIYLHYYSDGKEVMEKIMKSGKKFDAINCAAGDVVETAAGNDVVL